MDGLYIGGDTVGRREAGRRGESNRATGKGRSSAIYLSRSFIAARVRPFLALEDGLVGLAVGSVADIFSVSSSFLAS